MARSQIVVNISTNSQQHSGGRANQALGVSAVGDVVVEIDNAKVITVTTLRQALAQVITHYTSGSELKP